MELKTHNSTLNTFPLLLKRSIITGPAVALMIAIAFWRNAMGRSYFCPHCRRMLNPGTKVIFLVENGDDREMVLLSAKLGEYSVVHSRSMTFEEGKIYTFRCPICRADLTSSLDEKLVDILTQSDEEMMVRVSFSRVFGEQATFLRAPDGINSLRRARLAIRRRQLFRRRRRSGKRRLSGDPSRFPTCAGANPMFRTQTPCLARGPRADNAG